MLARTWTTTLGLRNVSGMCWIMRMLSDAISLSHWMAAGQGTIRSPERTLHSDSMGNGIRGIGLFGEGNGLEDEEEARGGGGKEGACLLCVEAGEDVEGDGGAGCETVPGLV